ncbi:MAG: hypothetical protein ACK559_21130, partial [bacterium]
MVTAGTIFEVDVNAKNSYLSMGAAGQGTFLEKIGGGANNPKMTLLMSDFFNYASISAESTGFLSEVKAQTNGQLSLTTTGLGTDITVTADDVLDLNAASIDADASGLVDIAAGSTFT